MTDPRTTVYLRYRGIGSLSQCEINRRLQEVRDKIIEPNRSNFIPELSPDWNPNTGTLETESRPVGMIDTGSNSNPSYIAKKWIIKD